MGRASSSLALAVLATGAMASCGGDDAQRPSSDKPRMGDPGAIHVHGLGVNPADGALFVATHTGLFRAPRGEAQARRVADRFQDTMGFTVIGADRFLGSGHPDGRDDLPPFLGLIETVDAGRSWKSVSLMGKRDFHVLEAAGKRIYGFGSDFQTRGVALLVSPDGGRSWEERTVPEPLVSLAIDPTDPERVLASGEQGLYVSSDGGRRWRSLAARAGLLAWSSAGAAYLMTLDGRLDRSADAGASWDRVGDVGGTPSAFESAGDQLYVALHDGTIKRSTDGGHSWALRLRP
jgi:hypothetical protein